MHFSYLNVSKQAENDPFHLSFIKFRYFSSTLVRARLKELSGEIGRLEDQLRALWEKDAVYLPVRLILTSLACFSCNVSV